MNMTKVDFGYIGRDGVTIYRMCFQKYIKVGLSQLNPVSPVLQLSSSQLLETSEGGDYDAQLHTCNI